MQTSSTIDVELIQKLPAKTALEWLALPLTRNNDGSISVALANIDDIGTVDNLGVLFGAAIVPVVWSKPDLLKAIEAHYGIGAQAVSELEDETPEADEFLTDVHPTNGAMVRIVDDLIQQAHQVHATDIHIEPFSNELLVRFRIDGLLHPAHVPVNLARFLPLLTSRIKIMAEMNIAEKRLPQDGRIRTRVGGEELDIRVSTIPTLHGESIDLRLLPRTRLTLGLEELGMASDHRETISALIKKPNGIILVTGPTGHGKTTTLYACLSQINSVHKKIITIEDPVEYQLRGINQIQVHSKIGLSFANGLRSILRQDPDVIMVGEIRDLDTAEIAIRASLTGHLVFSTLHTNDAVGAIIRLIDMGIEPYLVASSIHAVLAQRLVRLLCSDCKDLNPRGCETCRQTGFKGRTGIFELFLINDDIRQLILDRASQSVIRKKMKTIGMRSLYEDGHLKAKAGLTIPEELLRVTEDM